MTTSKIKIKLGAIEVEYEGSESFLKEELPQLLSAVSDLYAKSRAALEPPSSSQNTSANPPAGLNTNAGSTPKLEATTGSIGKRAAIPPLKGSV